MQSFRRISMRLKQNIDIFRIIPKRKPPDVITTPGGETEMFYQHSVHDRNY